ncbi:SMP-30/gluconolactonase/LRE family protein [Muricoccus pecuniae]|uniref:Sugar lactone lactonase YvrE n=1 Tax=Muricoccus pecuniae TaxID=693023 RepID=A0A840Y5A3_9PROT|nr:SMP-30/gluconolactonase/LRE family protein [Roseomonas pecuniae]MBB5694990.1 sugar lactone lactonase YvrE [Roseomonas pecuniae]
MSGPEPAGPPRLIWPAGAELGEGALWDDRIARLWWVDIRGRRLHRADEAGGSRASWDLAEEPGHAALTDDPARLILGLRSGPGLFEPATGRLERLAAPEGHDPSRHRLNDGKADAAGRLWFSTMEEGEEAPEGALHLLLGPGRAPRVAGPFTVANGPAFSPDGRTLYLGDSPAHTVFAYAMRDGRLGERREFIRFAGDDGFPDGMTVDAEGCLWVAHWDGGRVSRFGPDGAHRGSIALPVPKVTSLAFGGADFRTLFITTAGGEGREDEGPAGGLFAVRTEVAGLPAGRVRPGG